MGEAVISQEPLADLYEQGGRRFVERVLSVVATCRQQSRSVLECLTHCHRAPLLGLEGPTLVATHEAATALAGGEANEPDSG